MKTVEVMVGGESKLASKQAAYPSAPGPVELKWQRRLAHFSQQDSSMSQLIGRTRGDQVVAFDGSRGLKGKLLSVEIVAAKNLTLFGKLVEAAVSA